MSTTSNIARIAAFNPTWTLSNPNYNLNYNLNNPSYNLSYNLNYNLSYNLSYNLNFIPNCCQSCAIRWCQRRRSWWSEIFRSRSP